jgi:hypothetical protein
LVVGVLLVLASVALGAKVVASADDTVPVYAASVSLPIGAPIAQSSVRVVRVHLSSGVDNYLSATRPLPSSAVMTRSVAAGELVPQRALAPADSLTQRRVTIPVATIPVGIAAGGKVDIWSAAKDPAAVNEANGYRTATQLVAGVDVRSVEEPGSGFGASRGAGVEVILDSGHLKPVLDALANDARITLVAAPGGADGTA